MGGGGGGGGVCLGGGGGGGGYYVLDSGGVGMVSFGRNYSLITRCLVC